MGPRLAGVLTVYATGPELGSGLVEATELVAAPIGGGLYEMEVRADLRTTANQLEEALASRVVIDRAKGIVMAHRGCSAEEAFKHLVDSAAPSKRNLA
jgi:hypothetical protein